VLDARAEGLLLVGPTDRVPATFLKQIRDAGIALVSLSGVRFPDVPQVRSDFHQCAAELTNHLLGLGYRRLALLTAWGSRVKDFDHQWPVQERIDGFQEAIAKCGSSQVTGEVICGDEEIDLNPKYNNGRAAMQELLKRPDRPEAVLCTNDSWALGALAACAEAGVRVPQDIALTGIDNDPIGEIIQPPLTSSSQPTEAIATRAVEILMKQVRGEKLSTSEMLVKLPCQLVMRQSCGASLARRRG
jgi:DNA-binding LacI/PurR family transcriptional regulator